MGGQNPLAAVVFLGDHGAAAGRDWIMHLVFLNQYYPPDAAPTGVMLEAVAEECARLGHEVTVICAAGGYAGGGELSAGPPVGDSRSAVRIVRIGATRFGRGTFVGKLLDYASYYVGVASRLLWLEPRPDRVVGLTTPPFLSVLARMVSKVRGADHAHWVMDLYPDVMTAHGMLRESGLAYAVLAWLARVGFGGRRCAAVLTLGPDMAERVAGLCADPAVVSWVPLWGVDTEETAAGDGSGGGDGVAALRRARGWGEDDLVVMYSGNMGLGHRFGEILEVARRMGVDPEQAGVRFVFYGGGKRRGEIAEYGREHPGCGIELNDYAPAELLAAHLRSADVHLASLDEAWTGTMVPSKLQGVFAVGRPVVFIGAAESSIGRWVVASGGGWVVGPGDLDGLESAIREARNPAVREARGEAARAFAREHFDKTGNVRRVVEVLAAGTDASAPT
jgi:glycosyltransferase involved in cell wall biosynthesis